MKKKHGGNEGKNHSSFCFHMQVKKRKNATRGVGDILGKDDYQHYIIEGGVGVLLVFFVVLWGVFLCVWGFFVCVTEFDHTTHVNNV